MRTIDKSLLAVSLVIAVGVVLVVRGVAVSITGDERAGLPDSIESVDPVPDAVQVLSQTAVIVDLDPGLTGVLVIDDVEIPTIDLGEVTAQATAGEQIDLPAETVYEPGNATLTFTPSDDAIFSEFTSGLHRVQVIYWPIDEGRVRPRTFTWTFNVV